MPTHTSTTSIEREIVRMKSELVRISRDRNMALREGRQDEGHRHHLSALQTEIDHLGALARYVKTMSPAVARELATRGSLVAQHFERLKDTGSLRDLSRWVSQELAPLVNKSEQAAHLVATSVRASPRKPASPFVWPVAVDRALKEGAARDARGRPGRSR